MRDMLVSRRAKRCYSIINTMEKNNQKIVPNLWFDNQAKEAAEFYVSVFGNGSKVNHISQIHDTPSGSVDIVTFDVWGHSFMAISAGPLFN